jgi:protein-arginine kinase activator protein McsA
MMCDSCGVNEAIHEVESRDDAAGYAEVLRVCENCSNYRYRKSW